MNRRISAHRSLFQAACATCGASFLTGRSDALYCSNACRQKAYHMRHRRSHRQPLDQQLALPTTSTQGNGYETREWQGTPIQRRASDGWINATAMCQAGGKRWNHYAANDRTREYMAALQQALAAETPCAAAVAGNPATLPSVIEVRQGGDPRLQGTWIHPRLAVDLARWISPAFAVWMDGWFLESMQQPARPPLPACATAPTPLPAPLRQGHRIHIEADSDAEAAEVFLGAVMYYLRITVGILEPAHAWPDRRTLPYRRIV